MKGIKTLLLVLSSFIVSAWTLYLLFTPLKFALACMLFVITFVAGKALLNVNTAEEGFVKSRFSFSKFARKVSQIVPPVLLSVLLLVIALIPPIEGELFVAWPNLALPSVLRLVAAFGLNFLPGYIVLEIVGKRTQIRGLSAFISSFLLSLLLMTITGFVSAYAHGNVGVSFLEAFLLLNVALIIAYVLAGLVRLVRRRSDHVDSQGYVKPWLPRLPLLLLVLVIVFELVFWLLQYANIGFFIGGPGSDMWRIHGFSQSFAEYKAFAALHLPWWFYLYLACFFVLSGVPSVNAYFALFPLMVMTTLSFYLMASKLFRDRKTGALATLAYTLFSGSAWLYALFLRGFGPVTDVTPWGTVLSSVGNKFLAQGWYPPFGWGLIPHLIANIALWWMVYAVCRVNTQNKFNFSLLSIVFALSYLIHGVEPIIFVGFLVTLLFVYLFTRDVQGVRRVRWAAFSAVLALIMVSVIDLSLTSQYDSFNSTNIYALSSRYYYFNSPSFYVILTGVVAIIALTYIKLDVEKLISTSKSVSKYLKLSRIRLIEAIFYIYVISIILWIVFFSSYGLGWMNLGDIPWYVYPATGGVPFFLAIIGAAYAFHNWEKLEGHVRNTIAFCILSLGALFLMGELVSFVNASFFYTNFWERRILSYTQGVSSMVVAYAMVTIFNRIKLKTPHRPKEVAKSAIASLLFSLLILSSISSTLLSADYASHKFFSSSISEEELEALRYLHYELPKGLKTAYLSGSSGTSYIRGFANDKWDYDPFLNLERFPSSPELGVAVITMENVGFLYFHHTRDSVALKGNLFFQQLVEVLPKAFNNSEVTVYSIPPMISPTFFSPLVLAHPNQTSGEAYDAYVLWLLTFALGDSLYRIRNFSDDDIFDGSEVIVAPYDPMPYEVNATELMEWVTNGGHVVVSNTNPYGTFSGLLGLKPTVPLVNCDTTSNWTTLYKRGEILSETTPRIEGTSSLRLRNNSSSWETWIYTTPKPLNLSNQDYIGIWVYGMGGGPRWRFYLEDSNGVEGYFKYDLSKWDPSLQYWLPSFTGWKLHLIPIREYFGSLDLSSISKLKILAGSDLPTNFLIDDIFALEETAEEKQIVTTDGITAKEKIDLPTLQVQNLSLSEGLLTIANYTKDDVAVAPFAIQKGIGNGKITYLNINLLYDFILSEGGEFESLDRTLAQILEMVEAIV